VLCVVCAVCAVCVVCAVRALCALCLAFDFVEATQGMHRTGGSEPWNILTVRIRNLVFLGLRKLGANRYFEYIYIGKNDGHQKHVIIIKPIFIDGIYNLLPPPRKR
jgi:hypothetical protein